MEKLGKDKDILCFECSSLFQTGICELCLKTIEKILEQRGKNSKMNRDFCCDLI